MANHSNGLQDHTILVTGVTGNIGRATIHHLLKRGVDPGRIIGLARKKDGTEDLAAKGVAIRLGDYSHYDSLLDAFKGVDKVMLTSAVAFTDRSAQHKNVITAARHAGVKHVVYMAIMRKEGSGRVMPEITESDRSTEQALKSSGLAYTIVYHPPFMESVLLYFGSDFYADGIRVPANNGKMAPASRDELAEAHAVILSTPGHDNKSYSLGGIEAISFADVAKILGEIKGQSIPFSTITPQQYIDALVAQGLPSHVAEFITGWVLAIEGEEFHDQSGDLERLLGRKPKTFSEYITSTLA